MIPQALSQERYWNRITQTLPREALDRIHLARIKRLIAWAYQHSLLHRRLYDEAGLRPSEIQTWKDFYSRVPFTDKVDYMQDQEQNPLHVGGLALGVEYWEQRFHTTGTTGRFLQEVFGAYDWRKFPTALSAAFWDYGLRPGDSIYLCFNFGMWIGLWTWYVAARDMGLTIIPGGGLSSIERVRAILEYQPSLVGATPSYLLHLAEVARGEGLDLREAGVRVLSGGGEAGLSIPVTRQALAEAWGVELLMDVYGVGEIAFAGVSCREWGGGVHVVEDIVHAYVVNPETGQPVKPGEAGEQVVTSYNHFAQPFIKYRTHDLVRWEPKPNHGCGWTWTFLPGGVLGRTDFMVTIRGVNVYPTAVENLLGEVPGLTHHYELHITKQGGFDRMLVKVEAREDGGDREALARQLADHLQRLGVRLETEVVPPATLPRYELKAKRIIDHRNPEERPQVAFGLKAAESEKAKGR
jgi:phenylacetate-CoA ligase